MRNFPAAIVHYIHNIFNGCHTVCRRRFKFTRECRRLCCWYIDFCGLHIELHDTIIINFRCGMCAVGKIKTVFERNFFHISIISFVAQVCYFCCFFAAELDIYIITSCLSGDYFVVCSCFHIKLNTIRCTECFLRSFSSITT